MNDALLTDGECVLVAVSGGADSVALTLMLHELIAGGQRSLTLHLAHMNHGLRGDESDADEEFCRALAGRLDLPIAVARVQLPAAGSVEATARDARYAFLARTAAQVGATAVVTAHHADDQAETVLMRILRGAAVTGLGAIRPVRALDSHTRLVRPLLDVRKADILAFLSERGQPFRTDRSNADTSFTRNRIRHILIPALERDYPEFSAASLCNLARSARQIDAVVCTAFAKAWPHLNVHSSDGFTILDAEYCARLPVAVVKRTFIRIWQGMHPTDAPLSAAQLDALAELPGSPVGSRVNLPGRILATREHSVIHIGPPDLAAPLPERRLEPGVTLEIPECALRIESEILPPGSVTPEKARSGADTRSVFLNMAELPQPFTVRSRRSGDRFQPLGTSVPRSLKKYLIGKRTPRHMRDRTPLVVAADGRIAWIVGQTIAAPFALTEALVPVLHLRATDMGPRTET
jgi:tRNA(Ile)-lysidine synthase